MGINYLGPKATLLLNAINHAEMAIDPEYLKMILAI